MIPTIEKKSMISMLFVACCALMHCGVHHGTHHQPIDNKTPPKQNDGGVAKPELVAEPSPGHPVRTAPKKASGPSLAKLNQTVNAPKPAAPVSPNESVPPVSPKEPAPAPKSEPQADNNLKVLFFGDFGTGDTKQMVAAHGMDLFCRLHGCDMGLLLGDNFYIRGVKSVDDPQFETKFEKPYAPLRFPFYVVLGNHDTYSGPVGVKAQLEYSNRSAKWHLPERYYRFTKGNTEFFALDTNTYLSEKTQRTWLAEALANSSAKWKVVFGHHAIYSTGTHAYYDWMRLKPQERLRRDLQPLLCRYHALYLAGHEHIMQLNALPCGSVAIVSGAAADPRGIYPRMVNKQHDTLKFYRGDRLGFSYAIFKEDAVEISFLDQAGDQVFSYEFKSAE